MKVQLINFAIESRLKKTNPTSTGPTKLLDQEKLSKIVMS